MIWITTRYSRLVLNFSCISIRPHLIVGAKKQRKNKMNLSPEQEKIIKEIQSKYEDEMVEASCRAIKNAIYHVINYRDVIQSDIDDLLESCGVDRDDILYLVSFFE